MTSNEELIKLIKAHISGRNEFFTATIRELAALERRSGNSENAEALEKALSSNNPKASKELTRLNGASTYNGPRSIPLSKGDQFPLIEVKHPLSCPFAEIYQSISNSFTAKSAVLC